MGIATSHKSSRCGVDTSRRFGAALAAGAFGLFAWSSCGVPTNTNEQVSDLSHDVDQPVRNAETFNWTAVSDADYRGIMAPLLGLGDNFLADDHALVERTQFWIDAVDAGLRRRYPAKLANVPKPQARVIANPSVNAFIAPVPVCYEVAVKIGNSGGVAEDGIYFDHGLGEFSSWPAQIKCRAEGTSNADLATLRSMVATFNGVARNGCQLSVTTDAGSTVLNATEACPRNADLQGATRSQKLAFMRTAAYVNVYTGLLSAMDSEESFVGVITHELGHYYRSHLTAEEDFFGYFYEMARQNQASRPTRGSAAVQELGQKAVRASKLIGGGAAYFKKVADQKFSSKVYLGIGSYVEDTCKAGANCPAACTELRTYMNSTAYQSSTQMFPFRELSATGKTNYATFETKANTCLAALATSASSWAKMKTFVAEPIWPAWIFRGNYKEAVYDLQSSVVEFLPTSAPNGMTKALQGFASMTKALNDAETTAAVDLKTAFDRRLGQYTFEQEADDLSAEWLLHLNINPTFAADTQLNLGKYMASQGADRMMPFDLGYEECLRVRARGWKSEDGAYQYVAIGDYAEPHHGFCYRAFNVDREIEAHAYRLEPGAQPPQPTGPTWARLKELAEQATSPAAPAGGGAGFSGDSGNLKGNPAAAGILAKLQTRDCPWALPSMARMK